MRPLFALPLLLLSLHARGAEPHYLNAERDCRVANPQPQAELSATWEGACKDGYAPACRTAPASASIRTTPACRATSSTAGWTVPACMPCPREAS